LEKGLTVLVGDEYVKFGKGLTVLVVDESVKFGKGISLFGAIYLKRIY
jgi:hypothetical protein